MSDVTIDTSELDKLNAMLQRAADRTAKERKRALDKAEQTTLTEARATAGSYPNGTGALAASLESGGTDLTRTVGSAVREAWFLEVGTPKTGAPRPWLTGPAEAAVGDMLTELAKAAAPW